MLKKASKFIIFTFIFGVLLFAAPDEVKKKSFDWFQFLFTFGYLAGVFVLLPIILYTRSKEKLIKPDGNEQSIDGLDENERNTRSQKILTKIENSLTPYQSEDGEEMITITKAKQAKLVKNGLDYINTKLLPTDENIIDRTKEFERVYEDRIDRAFTGSKWIIACSVGFGVLMFVTAGFQMFLVIHILGLIFYILSSRATMYSIEKRAELFGSKDGAIGGIMSSLFLGDGTKYYVKHGSGPWKRDYETEFSMSIVGLLALFVIAFFLGAFAALMGVINFVINYSGNLILPFKKIAIGTKKILHRTIVKRYDFSLKLTLYLKGKLCHQIMIY